MLQQPHLLLAKPHYVVAEAILDQLRKLVQPDANGRLCVRWPLFIEDAHVKRLVQDSELNEAQLIVAARHACGGQQTLTAALALLGWNDGNEQTADEESAPTTKKKKKQRRTQLSKPTAIQDEQNSRLDTLRCLIRFFSLRSSTFFYMCSFFNFYVYL